MVDNLLVKFMSLAIIVISIGLHEFAHAAMSTKLGDPIPRHQGRLTPNPMMHFDVFGFFFIVMTVFGGFGLGWGRPVQTNPLYYDNLRQGIILTAIAGPMMNLALASFAIGISYAFFMGNVALNQSAHIFLFLFIAINLGLALFNLLPVPPLDGGHVLQQLFPRNHFVNQMTNYGFLVLIGLMIFGVLGQILWMMRSAVFALIGLLFGGEFLHYLAGAQF